MTCPSIVPVRRMLLSTPVLVAATLMLQFVFFTASMNGQSSLANALQAPASASAEAEGPRLEGSWDITITTTPNPPFAVPFRILRTVSATGVVDAYAFPPITPTVASGIPLSNSSGHGNWGRIGRQLFSVTVKYFQLNTAKTDVLDSVGTVRENIRLSPDGNSYSSVFQTEVLLPNGNIVRNSGRTEAKRIQVQPIPDLP